MKSKHKDLLSAINSIIQANVKNGLIDNGDISDGHHTFDELYDIRLAYNVALFNEWATENPHEINAREKHNENNSDDRTFYPKYNVHKSLKHYDGDLCFGGGWFIVVAMLPTGQITNHYRIEHWDKFKIPEAETAKYEFDGHTTQDCINRLNQL